VGYTGEFYASSAGFQMYCIDLADAIFFVLWFRKINTMMMMMMMMIRSGRVGLDLDVASRFWSPDVGIL